MRTLYFFIICFWITTYKALSQSIEFERFIEENFGWQDSELPYEDLYESLLSYYVQPLNLNKASKSDLENLYVLSPIQVSSILEYRDMNGAFLSNYELQSVPNLDIVTIKKLLPFVKISESELGQKPFRVRIKEAPNSYLLIRNSHRIQSAKGYISEKYAGNRLHSYARLRVSNPHDFSFGFTAEKDPGEPVTWNENTKFIDHLTAHALVENRGVMKKLIVGDYQVQFGQGLVFGAGFNPGKGAETIQTTRRGNVGILPYGSVIESGFFRGIATTFEQNNYEITMLLSRLRQDGNRLNDTTYSDFDEYINSIQTTGLHRTSNEIDAKNAIEETNIGLNWLYKPSAKIEIGATLIHTRFDTPIQKKPNDYNQYEFTGDQNTVGSSYFNFNWQNMLLFGESAVSFQGHGSVFGLITTISSKLDLAIVGRNYQPTFHSFYGNAFSESSRIINEKGVYWGLQFHTSRKHQFNLYYDYFIFPWLRFGINAPSRGSEWLLKYDFNPNKSSQLYAIIRQEIKQESIQSESEKLSLLIDRVKWQGIINYHVNASEWLTFRTRLQGSIIFKNGSTSQGVAVIQDLTANRKSWKLSARLAVFDTDDFDNRQYVFEHNVLYAFSMPAYSGTGIRQYLLLSYDLSRSTTFYARYSQSSFPDSRFIGSGLEEIKGNKRSDLTLQLRVKL